MLQVKGMDKLLHLRLPGVGPVVFRQHRYIKHPGKILLQLPVDDGPGKAELALQLQLGAQPDQHPLVPQDAGGKVVGDVDVVDGPKLRRLCRFHHVL